MKLFRKILTAVLTGAFALQSIAAPMTAYAAEAAQERAAEPTILVEMERGLVADFAGTSFDGTNAVTVAEQMNLFADNMRKANALKMSVKFKLADGAGDFTSLLDILNSQDNRQSMSLIVNKNGTVYLMTGSLANRSNVHHKFSNIADGQFHTLNVTVTAETVVIELDGVTATVNVINESDYHTKDFLTAFFGNPTGDFTDWRGNIDAITVGGMHPDTYQDSESWTDLKGEISEVSVGKYEALVTTGDAFFGAMFVDSVDDNNWLFGGGAETQGRFADLRGLRNYIGHFEEYVRNSKAKANTTGMQRHTVNAGKAGRDAAGFAEDLEDLINRSNPKAVAYLIGAEDYSQGEDGLDAFKDSIESILNQALAMKDGQGCAVLQLPHAVNGASASANVKLYAEAARAAYNGIASQDAQKAGRMILVDHLAQTDNDSFKNTKLTEEGLLNVEGQYEISRQFTKAVCASNDSYASLSGFPSIDTYKWTVQEAPETYLDAMPEVTAYGNRLRVMIKDAAEDAEWKYIVTVDGAKITGEAAGNPFVISSLPEEAKYSLTVQTKDGKTQYAPAAGVLEDGETAAAPETEGEIPKKIRALAEDKSKPLTWLFIGDSITHSAVHTRGYDGIAQLFEKYVKEDLGRTDDLVVNTATSGGTVPNTINYFEYRVRQYKPDIVSIMLGTNDARNRDKKEEKVNFKTNLLSLVEKIREANPNAIIIFRSPTQGVGGWTLDPWMLSEMKAAAEEAGNIFYIDQYTEWAEGFAAYPYLSKRQYYLGDDAVHPGAAGHEWMTEKFIRECGLDMNTRIANFEYELLYAEETSETEPDVAVAGSQDAVTVSKTALQAKYGAAGQIGDIEVVLTDEDGRAYAKQGTLSDDEVTVSGLPGGSYTVRVTANIKGSVAKKVTFAGSEITLEQETVSGRQEADSVIDQILVIGTLDAGEKCGQKIQEAQDAYDKLTDAQKALVSEAVLAVLADAKEEYANLKAQAEDQKAADAVAGKIDAIGDVSYDTAIKAKIDEAREAYDELTADQKALIGADVLKKLTDAEEEYDNLEAEAKEQADQDAANAVIDEISAIGNVSYNAASKAKIEEARKAYNKLTADQKALIGANVLKKLTDAETAYGNLEAKEQADKDAAKKVQDLISAIGAVANTPASQQKIDAAKAAYDKLTEAQKKLLPASVTQALTNAANKIQELKDVTSFVSGNYNYKVTDASLHTVEVTGAVKKKAAIDIPNDVTYKNQKYTVTSIAAKAFKNDKKATKLTVGKNVQKIGDQAFYGCNKLKTATLNSTKLSTIGKQAFYNCKALKKIIIKSKKLKSAGKNAFKGIDKNAAIKVPSSKLKQYKNKILKNKGQGKKVKITK